MPSRKTTTLATLLFFTVVLGIYTNVPTYATNSDKLALTNIYTQFGKNFPSEVPKTFDEEINRITEAQAAITSISKYDNGIPESEHREPEDLIRWKRGSCYDRSRSIEKALAAQGFSVRHISIYWPKQPNHSYIETIAKTKTPSHAVTEVLTSKGWLVVGSNDQWMAVKQDGTPASIYEMANSLKSTNTPIKWRNPEPTFYKKNFFFVYGLYSRHGMFYPPYIHFPNINWLDFLYNFTQPLSSK